jgi:integrase/recombinase XerD
MSPLRRCAIEDIPIRKFAPRSKMTTCSRSRTSLPSSDDRDLASFEDVRRYQLHLASSGFGVPTINQSVSTLRFFFKVTLRRHEIVEHRASPPPQKK